MCDMILYFTLGIQTQTTQGVGVSQKGCCTFFVCFVVFCLRSTFIQAGASVKCTRLKVWRPGEKKSSFVSFQGLHGLGCSLLCRHINIHLRATVDASGGVHRTIVLEQEWGLNGVSDGISGGLLGDGSGNHLGNNRLGLGAVQTVVVGAIGLSGRDRGGHIGVGELVGVGAEVALHLVVLQHFLGRGSLSEALAAVHPNPEDQGADDGEAEEVTREGVGAVGEGVAALILVLRHSAHVRENHTVEGSRGPGALIVSAVDEGQTREDDVHLGSEAVPLVVLGAGLVAAAAGNGLVESVSVVDGGGVGTLDQPFQGHEVNVGILSVAAGRATVGNVVAKCLTGPVETLGNLGVQPAHGQHSSNTLVTEGVLGDVLALGGNHGSQAHILADVASEANLSVVDGVSKLRDITESIALQGVDGEVADMLGVITDEAESSSSSSDSRGEQHNAQSKETHQTSRDADGPRANVAEGKDSHDHSDNQGKSDKGIDGGGTVRLVVLLDLGEIIGDGLEGGVESLGTVDDVVGGDRLPRGTSERDRTLTVGVGVAGHVSGADEGELGQEEVLGALNGAANGATNVVVVDEAVDGQCQNGSCKDEGEDLSGPGGAPAVGADPLGIGAQDAVADGAAAAVARSATTTAVAAQAEGSHAQRHQDQVDGPKDDRDPPPGVGNNDAGAAGTPESPVAVTGVLAPGVGCRVPAEAVVEVLCHGLPVWGSPPAKTVVVMVVVMVMGRSQGGEGGSNRDQGHDR